MIEGQIRELWTPTGLVLGFQVTLFKWRIEREVGLTDKTTPGGTPVRTYLVPSDYLSITGMFCFLVGVILLPTMGASYSMAQTAFGLGVLFFVGQVLGLAGHYDLFNRLPRNTRYFPVQERWAVGVTVTIAIAYTTCQAFTWWQSQP